MRCSSAGARLNKTRDQKESLSNKVHGVCSGSSFCFCIYFRRFNWFIKHFTAFSFAHKDPVLSHEPLKLSSLEEKVDSGFMFLTSVIIWGSFWMTSENIWGNPFPLSTSELEIVAGSALVDVLPENTLSVSPQGSSPCRPQQHSSISMSPSELLFSSRWAWERLDFSPRPSQPQTAPWPALA